MWLKKYINLLTKVEFVTNLQSLKEFQILLQQNEIINYFYCNKLLKNSIHVDHFIPWSQNDLLWNFVLACPSCNTNKNDKLAIEIYLENLITRNEQLKSIESLLNNLKIIIQAS